MGAVAGSNRPGGRKRKIKHEVRRFFLFDENGKLIERLYYYLDCRRGSMILDYIGSDLYKDMVWSDYGRMRSKECL